MADDAQERSMGLMFRDRLAPKMGMLFVMPKPERASFWMKNTTLPLSVAYINPAGVILEIHDLQPLDESRFPAPSRISPTRSRWSRDGSVKTASSQAIGSRGLPAFSGQ